MIVTVKLTEPQEGAFQCRDWSEEPLTRAAWSGGRLTFDSADAWDLLTEITDASNAEDEFAQTVTGECRTHANRAAQVLANVTKSIVRALHSAKREASR